MPKAMVQDPRRPKSRRRLNVVQKFKIGNRKSTQSATRMSNKDLRDVFATSDSGKYRQKARRELERRGAALVIEVVEVEEVAA